MHFGIRHFHSAFGIFIWHLAFSFSSGIQQFHSSILFAFLFSDNRHNQFLTARSPICLMSGKLIFLALLVWQLDDPGAVLRWAAMPPPAPPLPPRPSAGLAGLDSFLQEMDEILTNSNIHSTTGEVARAPGHGWNLQRRHAGEALQNPLAYVSRCAKHVQRRLDG